jgi:hypothetical protein
MSLTAAVTNASDRLLALVVPRREPAQAADCWIEWWNDAQGSGNDCFKRRCCDYGTAVRCNGWGFVCHNCSCPP